MAELLAQMTDLENDSETTTRQSSVEDRRSKQSSQRTSGRLTTQVHSSTAIRDEVITEENSDEEQYELKTIKMKLMQIEQINREDIQALDSESTEMQLALEEKYQVNRTISELKKTELIRQEKSTFEHQSRLRLIQSEIESIVDAADNMDSCINEYRELQIKLTKLEKSLAQESGHLDDLKFEKEVYARVVTQQFENQQSLKEGQLQAEKQIEQNLLERRSVLSRDAENLGSEKEQIYQQIQQDQGEQTSLASLKKYGTEVRNKVAHLVTQKEKRNSDELILKYVEQKQKIKELQRRNSVQIDTSDSGREDEMRNENLETTDNLESLRESGEGTPTKGREGIQKRSQPQDPSQVKDCCDQIPCSIF